MKKMIEQFLGRFQNKPSVDEQRDQLRHQVREWLRFSKQSESHRHEKNSWESHGLDLLKTFDQYPDLDLVHQRFDSTVERVIFFKDTWEKHGIEQTFTKESHVKIKGGTLLHIACALGQTSMVQSLLEMGWDRYAKDENDNTPLDLLSRHPNMMDSVTWDAWMSSVPSIKPQTISRRRLKVK